MLSGLKEHLCLFVGFLLMPNLLHAQQETIHGKVMDAQGEPIMQAHISVIETSQKTIFINDYWESDNFNMKVQPLSFYKVNPDPSSEDFQNRETRSDDRYYTFDYAIQLNKTNQLN